VSNNLDLSQVAAAQNQKEVTINDQAGQLDAALTAVLTVAVDDSNAATLTAAQFRRAFFFVITSDTTPPDDAITITVPAVMRGLFKVINDTAQAVSVEVSGQSKTAPSTAPGAAAILSCDGSDVRAAAGGALADLDDLAITGPSQGQMLRFDGAVWVNETTPYDLMTFLPGTFHDGELMLRLVFNRSVAFPAALAGSAGYAGVNATGTTALDLQKNGSPIGTITFTNAGASATFALSGGASFAAGDRLEIINANPADATLADISLALKGIRS
jgi:hypothetical protein